MARYIWTAVIYYPSGNIEEIDIEEIDIEATSHAQAVRQAEEEAERDYEPGWDRIELVPFGTTCDTVTVL